MKIELSKKEIEAIIKCINTAIMFYITHKWYRDPRGKRKLESISLDKLREKFIKAIRQKDKDSIIVGEIGPD